MRRYRNEEHRRFVKRLRTNMTDAERVMWHHLLARCVLGWKLRRQVPIGPCVADLLCPEKRLDVEIDGGASDARADANRDATLARVGLRTVRSLNLDVLSNLDGPPATLKAELER